MYVFSSLHPAQCHGARKCQREPRKEIALSTCWLESTKPNIGTNIKPILWTAPACNDLEIEQCSCYKWNRQPHSPRHPLCGSSISGCTVSRVTWLALHPTLVKVQGRLQTDACLPSCRTQFWVDLCCFFKWLESHGNAFLRRCLLFWAGKRKNSLPCISRATLGKNTQPLKYLPIWSKWCYGTSFLFSPFILPARTVILTILLTNLSTTSSSLPCGSKLRLCLSPLPNNIFPIPLAPYLTSHSSSAAPSLPMGSACVLPLHENGELFLNNPLGVISWKPVLLKLRSPSHHVPRFGAQA